MEALMHYSRPADRRLPLGAHRVYIMFDYVQ